MTKAIERVGESKTLNKAKETVWKDLGAVRNVATGRFAIRKEGNVSVTVRTHKPTGGTQTKK